MSEAQTVYGTPVHKYKVGDTFDFDGIVEILKVNGYDPAKRECTYQVKMADGRIVDVEESWIDGGIDHFDLDEHGRAKEKEYAVSYIASAPEELKVGDRVEVVGKVFPSSCIGMRGVVTSLCEDKDGKFVKISNAEHKDYPCTPDQLRKLPDTSNPMDRQVGGNHYDMPIQPVEFIERNNLGFCVGNCIKYLCRYKKENGKQDLEKARHYIDLLIQLEYPE